MSNEQTQQTFSTEHELLTRCQKGDRAAFNHLIRTYQHQVFTYLSHLTDDRSTAEELTKQTFIAAYKRMNRYPANLGIHGWLLSLAEQQIHTQTHRPRSWFLAFFSKRQPQPIHDDERPEAFGTKEHASPDCQTISPLLSAFLDGELGEFDAKRVERHMQQCEHCQQEYDELVDTLNIVQTFGQRQAPPDLRVHINAAIDELSFNWDSLTNWFGMPASRIVGAMAMLMVVCSAFLIYSQQQTIQNQQQEIIGLQQKFVSDVQRGRGPDEEQPTKTTFVILTGAATVKEMLFENADWFSKYITASPEETELLFIQGTQAELGRMIEERIQAINGTILDDDLTQEKSFHVRTLSVEAPENISEFLLSVLRPLDAARAASPAGMKTTTLTIMIIEKQ